MDPLSLSASVAGLLSLTLELGKSLHEYISEVKSAPSEATRLLTEVEALGEVSKQLVAYLRGDDAPKDARFGQTSVLWSVITVCERRVKELYQKLPKIGNSGKKHQNVLERFKWPFGKDEYMRDLSFLQRCCQTLQFSMTIENCALVSKNSKYVLIKLEEQQGNMKSIETMFHDLPPAMKQMSAMISTLVGFIPEMEEMKHDLLKISDSVHQLQQHSHLGLVQDLLAWLSTLEPEKRHYDIKSRRLKNTGSWLLQHPDFQLWRNGRSRDGVYNPVFSCHGDPGVGKSVLCTGVVDHLNEKCEHDKVAVAYIYCDYRDRNGQTIENMLGSLLKQLVRQVPTGIPEKLIESFQKRAPLEVKCIIQYLTAILHRFQQSYICIDALDECENRRELLSSLSELLPHFPQLGLFLTGRPHVKQVVEACLDSHSLTTIEIRANEEDIHRFIKNEIDNDQKIEPDLMNEKLQREIIEAIVARSQGMFLLPALQIRTVLENPTISQRRLALQKLPKGLHEAFKVNINRIREQPEAKAAQAMKVLTWVHLGRRPIEIEELRHALAVKPDDTDLDWDNFPSVKSILDCCLGLVTIDEETSTIRLVHFSLQEYLSTGPETLIMNPHTQLAETCLLYMSFKCLYVHLQKRPGSSNSKQFEDVGRLMETYPLLKYASYQWGHHARAGGDRSVESLALSLLCRDDPRSNLVLAAFSYNISQSWGLTKVGPIGGLKAIHLASFFGLPTIITKLFQIYPDDIDARDEIFNQTPLSWAAHEGHESIVQLLLQREDVDVNVKDDDGQTPLHSAAFGGYDKVVQLLLQREDVDVNLKDDYGRTPLHGAAFGGYDKVVQLLQQREDVEVSCEDDG